MTQPFKSDEQWSRCPIGHLQRYAQAEKRQLWLRLAGQATAVVALLAVTASSAIYSYRSMAPAFAPDCDPRITVPGCQEIAPLIDDFNAGKLSQEESEKVRRHLEKCYHCRRQITPHALRAGGFTSLHSCPLHGSSSAAHVTTTQ